MPVSGKSPGEGNGYPLQYSCLENPMDRGAWQTTVHRVNKGQTQLKPLSIQAMHTQHRILLRSLWLLLLSPMTTSPLFSPKNGSFPKFCPGALSSSLPLRVSSLTAVSTFSLLLWIPGEGKWHPTPVLLPGKSHGWRSLVGCSPWGHEESDTTERLHFHFSLSCIGQGNGNPLQCSCLENPRDRGAWWADVYGVAQCQTRLK